jgi:hypothetical protein
VPRHDCPMCRCGNPAAREMRLQEIAWKIAEQEFVQRHSVLTDEQLSWARSFLAKRREAANA